MGKAILWIDDSASERAAAGRMLSCIEGLSLLTASSYTDARTILRCTPVDAVVTDILRRDSNGTSTQDDGYAFFAKWIRSNFPQIPVIFHTKNLPETFFVDRYSQYLSKWDSENFKAIELDARLNGLLYIYEAFADYRAWQAIQPRLVEINTKLIDKIRAIDYIWLLTNEQFEQLAGELLEKIGYKVLWVPGGKDGGIDIVASSTESTFLIDVKRYRTSRPVTVDMVRRVYGVASASAENVGRTTYGGIITSSYFTKEAENFRKSVRQRPLLRDMKWLRERLENYRRVEG